MKRFVGLSLMCLLFVSVHAESEIEGSSWSLQLVQNNDEPIQVQSERKEYDKTGVTLHRKSRGIIENGVYKPINGEDVNDSEQIVPFKIKFLHPKEDDQGSQKRKFVKNERPHYRLGHRGFWDRGGFFGRGHLYQEQEDSQDKEFQTTHSSRYPMVDRNSRIENSEDEEMHSKLRNRSRVSFYRPVEKMFEKLFGTDKEKKFKHRHDRGLHKQRHPFWHKGQDQGVAVPVKQMNRKHFDQQQLLENYERQRQALMKKMRELEESFFGDFYVDEE